MSNHPNLILPELTAEFFKTCIFGILQLYLYVEKQINIRNTNQLVMQTEKLREKFPRSNNALQEADPLCNTAMKIRGISIFLIVFIIQIYSCFTPILNNIHLPHLKRGYRGCLEIKTLLASLTMREE